MENPNSTPNSTPNSRNIDLKQYHAAIVDGFVITLENLHFLYRCPSLINLDEKDHATVNTILVNSALNTLLTVEALGIRQLVIDTWQADAATKAHPFDWFSEHFLIACRLELQRWNSQSEQGEQS